MGSKIFKSESILDIHKEGDGAIQGSQENSTACFKGVERTLEYNSDEVGLALEHVFYEDGRSVGWSLSLKDSWKTMKRTFLMSS